MDIAKRKPIEREVDIIDPADETGVFKTGIRVTLMSISDERMKKIKRSIQDTRINLEKRGKTFKTDDIEENRSEICFKGMTGWSWGKDDNGEQATFKGEIPEFNRKNVIAIFNECEWFRNQVEVAISEEQSFFAK